MATLDILKLMEYTNPGSAGHRYVKKFAADVVAELSKHIVRQSYVQWKSKVCVGLFIHVSMSVLTSKQPVL